MINCKRNGNKLNLCSALGNRLSENTGFSLIRTINTKTGIEKDMGIAYKINKKDRGIFLNFCPFCGSSELEVQIENSKGEKEG